jgi:hypothetical protein
MCAGRQPSLAVSGGDQETPGGAESAWLSAWLARQRRQPQDEGAAGAGAAGDAAGP